MILFVVALIVCAVLLAESRIQSGRRPFAWRSLPLNNSTRSWKTPAFDTAAGVATRAYKQRVACGVSPTSRRDRLSREASRIIASSATRWRGLLLGAHTDSWWTPQNQIHTTLWNNRHRRRMLTPRASVEATMRGSVAFCVDRFSETSRHAGVRDQRWRAGIVRAWRTLRPHTHLHAGFEMAGIQPGQPVARRWTSHRSPTCVRNELRGAALRRHHRHSRQDRSSGAEIVGLARSLPADHRHGHARRRRIEHLLSIGDRKCCAGPRARC
jgi:hypothetical protein